jgi:pentatricopeptide repeat protein
MQQEGVQLNAVTFVGVLNACDSIMTLDQGSQAHNQILESGCESNLFVGSSLIDMYAKCGSMEEALRVFNNMQSQNVVSWKSVGKYQDYLHFLLGHVKCGKGRKH